MSGQGRAVEVGRGGGEAGEDDPRDACARAQFLDHGCNSNARSAIGGKSVDAGRDGGKRNAFEAMFGGELHRIAVGGGEQRVLILSPAVPNGANGVNDVPSF